MSREVLNIQKQWSQKVKEADDFDAPKVDQDNWEKIMECIILHLKFIREVRGTMLAYVVQHYVKMVHILFWYLAYLNLEKEMIAIAPLQLIQCQTPED